MENTDRQKLEREYIKRLKGYKYWVIRYTGFSRFSIINDRIVKKSLSSILCGTFIMIFMLVMLIDVVYETTVVVKYLLYTELSILLELSFLIYLVVLDITFSNKGRCAKLINYSIDIDVLLGIKETKFMRDIAENSFKVMGIPLLIIQILIVTFLYYSFDTTVMVHITGSLYFFWLICVFNDINYLLSHSSFVSMRTKYLNVALIKLLDVEVEYVPDLFMFSGVFWKRKHNDLVKFHEKADTKQFVLAYKMLFNYMKLFEECYRFIIFIGIVCIAIGSLFSVQSVLLYGRSDTDMIRKFIMIGWQVVSWTYLFTVSFQVDTFSRQINQTKLICSYAQLKSITNESVYRFTKAVLRAMESRVPRMSIYGLYFFEPGVMLRIAASTFVYLTAQLQISMPTEDRVLLNNTSTAVPVDIKSI